MKTKAGEAMAAPCRPLCPSLLSGNGRHFACVGGRLLRCGGGAGVVVGGAALTDGMWRPVSAGYGWTRILRECLWMT